MTVVCFQAVVIKRSRVWLSALIALLQGKAYTNEAAANNKFKPFASLTRTPSTPHLFAYAFGIFTQTALHTSRLLTKR